MSRLCGKLSSRLSQINYVLVAYFQILKIQRFSPLSTTISYHIKNQSSKLSIIRPLPCAQFKLPHFPAFATHKLPMPLWNPLSSIEHHNFTFATLFHHKIALQVFLASNNKQLVSLHHSNIKYQLVCSGNNELHICKCYIDVGKKEWCRKRIIKRRRKSKINTSKAWKLGVSRSVSFHIMQTCQTCSPKTTYKSMNTHGACRAVLEHDQIPKDFPC